MGKIRTFVQAAQNTAFDFWEGLQTTFSGIKTSIWIPKTTDTNANAAIKPKGNGANVAQDPDGTTTGGNARGAYATDWQKIRSNAADVASGTGSVISGGEDNEATSQWSTVGGGRGNRAIDIRSTISGGINNTAGGGRSTVGGGDGCQAGGSYSTVGGGRNNNASNTFSTVSGGAINTASAHGSTVCGGLRGVANKYGQFTHASGRFVSDGDAQYCRYIVRTATTDATANVELFLDGTGGSNRITIPEDTAYQFHIYITSIENTGNNTKSSEITGLIRRQNGGNATIVGQHTDGNKTFNDGGFTPSYTVSADTTNQALKIDVTGLAATNIHTVARVDITEVKYA